MKSAERLKFYVGITGVTRHDEAKTIAAENAAAFSPDSSHMGMAGYLVSDTTLAGKPELHRLPTGEFVTRSRYPVVRDLPGLLRLSKNDATLNMIHYRTSDRQTPLSDQVMRLFNSRNIYADDLCRAIQFNMNLPRPDQLARIKSRLPDLKIVLALSRRMIENHNSSDPSADLYKQLERYRALMDYILVDFSGGAHRGFSPDQAQSPYQALVEAQFDQPIILAGGFDAQNVSQRLPQLKAALGSQHWGIDAEGGLRYPPDDEAKNRLHPQLIAAYIRRSAHFFNTLHQETQ